MRPHVLRTALAVALTAGVIGAGQPAVAATDTDTTPPVLSVPAPTFVVGTSIGPSVLAAEILPDSYTDEIAAQLRWSATDASGVCSYDLSELYAGMAPQLLLEATRATAFRTQTSDYDGSFGGGSFVVTGWRVRAADCAGNTSVVDVRSRVTVFQDDGRSPTEWEPLPIAYGGAWTTSACKCWSGGTTRRTEAKGASATFTKVFGKGERVALVMAHGPDRGRARILVDGKLRKTVDTFAATRTHRVVTFETGLSAGTHTIKIVNLATPDRPRIDLDAVLVN